MNIRLEPQGHDDIVYTSFLPSGAGRKLPGAHVWSSAGPFGSITLQEAALNGWVIRYHHSRLHQPVTLHSSATAPAACLHFRLSNQAPLRIGDSCTVKVPEDGYNLLACPAGLVTTHLGPGEHRYLDILMSAPGLQQLAPEYPALRGLLQQLLRGQAGSIRAGHAPVSMEMKAVIAHIFGCRYRQEARKVYLTAKISELLMLALPPLCMPQPAAAKIALHPADVLQIEAARRYLEQHIDEPCTILQLARKVGINDHKLKHGFKQLFGATIFDFITRQRMERACALLLQGALSLEEVALQAGYRNVSNFTAAFKRHIGIPPGAYRKRAAQPPVPASVPAPALPPAKNTRLHKKLSGKRKTNRVVILKFVARRDKVNPGRCML